MAQKDNNNDQMKEAMKFIFALLAFVLILFVGKIKWLGKASAEAGSRVEQIFSTDLGGIHITLGTILAVIAVLLFMDILVKVVNFVIPKLAKSDRSKTVVNRITNIISWIGVILAVVWALSVLGLDPAAAFASIGIVALIIGFGAQSLIEDVISGLFLVFENQINVGDVVVLDDFRGTVKRIGMRTTSIVDPGGNYKIVNNSSIRNMQNRSLASSLAICDIGITYDEDVRRVEDIMSGLFAQMYEANQDVWLAAPYYLGVQEVGDSGIILRYAVDCVESKFFPAKRRLNRAIRLAFADNGITIPYKQVDVHNK